MDDYITNIIYFESMGRKIRIFTLEGKDSFYGTMKDVMGYVNKYQFMQIHRSYIINYNHIRIFKSDEVIMSNRMVLPVSQLRRKEIRSLQSFYEGPLSIKS